MKKNCSNKEAADYIGVARSTLEKWRCLKRIDAPPYHKCGRRVIYAYADLDRWLAANRRDPAEY